MTEKVGWFYCGNCAKDASADVFVSYKILDVEQVVVVTVEFICDTCGARLLTEDCKVALEA